MARRSFVQIGGKLYERGVDDIPETAVGQAPAVLGDIPDFRSSIDGSIVRGRAGLRDHCAKHNVVPTAELKGLPPKTMNQEFKPSAAHREATKRVIADVINSRGYFK